MSGRHYARVLLTDVPTRGGASILACALCGHCIAAVGGGGLALCEPCWRDLLSGETRAKLEDAERLREKVREHAEALVEMTGRQR